MATPLDPSKLSDDELDHLLDATGGPPKAEGLSDEELNQLLAQTHAAALHPSISDLAKDNVNPVVDATMKGMDAMGGELASIPSKLAGILKYGKNVGERAAADPSVLDAIPGASAASTIAGDVKDRFANQSIPQSIADVGGAATMVSPWAGAILAPQLRVAADTADEKLGLKPPSDLSTKEGKAAADTLVGLAPALSGKATNTAGGKLAANARQGLESSDLGDILGTSRYKSAFNRGLSKHLQKVEDTVLDSNLFSGAKNYDYKTGKFSGEIGGQSVSEIHGNVQNALSTLNKERTTALDNYDTVLSQYNQAHGANGIKLISGDDVGSTFDPLFTQLERARRSAFTQEEQNAITQTIQTLKQDLYEKFDVPIYSNKPGAAPSSTAVEGTIEPDASGAPVNPNGIDGGQKAIGSDNATPSTAVGDANSPSNLVGNPDQAAPDASSPDASIASQREGTTQALRAKQYTPKQVNGIIEVLYEKARKLGVYDRNRVAAQQVAPSEALGEGVDGLLNVIGGFKKLRDQKLGEIADKAGDNVLLKDYPKDVVQNINEQYHALRTTSDVLDERLYNLSQDKARARQTVMKPDEAQTDFNRMGKEGITPYVVERLKRLASDPSNRAFSLANKLEQGGAADIADAQAMGNARNGSFAPNTLEKIGSLLQSPALTRGNTATAAFDPSPGLAQSIYSQGAQHGMMPQATQPAPIPRTAKGFADNQMQILSAVQEKLGNGPEFQDFADKITKGSDVQKEQELGILLSHFPELNQLFQQSKSGAPSEFGGRIQSKDDLAAIAQQIEQDPKLSNTEKAAQWKPLWEKGEYRGKYNSSGGTQAPSPQ